MVCALLERARSGKGQVVDAAMVDGAATLVTIFYAAQQSGWWTEDRGRTCSTAARTSTTSYETSDGKYVSIGSIEPQFYAELLEQARHRSRVPARSDGSARAGRCCARARARSS